MNAVYSLNNKQHVRYIYIYIDIGIDIRTNGIERGFMEKKGG